MILLSEDRRKKGNKKHEKHRKKSIAGTIKGNVADIRDELAIILTELNKTPAGISLVLDALEQSQDPEWQDFYDSEIRAFPDPNRRNKA